MGSHRHAVEASLSPLRAYVTALLPTQLMKQATSTPVRSKKPTGGEKRGFQKCKPSATDEPETPLSSVVIGEPEDEWTSGKPLGVLDRVRSSTTLPQLCCLIGGLLVGFSLGVFLPSDETSPRDITTGTLPGLEPRLSDSHPLNLMTGARNP